MAEFEDNVDGLEKDIDKPLKVKNLFVGKNLTSISINSKDELCVVHTSSKLSFIDKDLTQRIREDIDKKALLQSAAFTATDDIVVMRSKTDTKTNENMVELLQNWRNIKFITKKCLLPSNLNEPYDCWLSRNPNDRHVLILADMKSSIFQSRDHGKMWVPLKLKPPLTNHWCAVKSGKRLWTVGNLPDGRASLTGYELHRPAGNAGFYELKRTINKITRDGNDEQDFHPYHLTVDRNKNLIIVDYHNYAIHLFNKKGDYLRQLFNKVDLEELRPRCVALSTNEKTLYVGTTKGYVLALDYNTDDIRT